MTDRPRCGSTDTETGDPCQNPAGYGTESDIGPCHLHPAEGRPSKFTDERAQQAIEAARECKSLRGCSRAAGVHIDTLKNWLQKNPNHRTEAGKYIEFFDAFMRARSDGESLLVRGGLTRPDEINPQHARFLLKTSFGYQETERVEFEDTTEQERTDTIRELESLFSE